MNRAKILVKFPTRQRPARFIETLSLYRTLANSPEDIQYIITCDEDDPTMNNPQMRKHLSWLDNTEVHFGKSKTKIEACNADVPQSGWDILVLASDDMLPRRHGWDDEIRMDMKYHFKDFDGVINYHDGHQRDKINTLPVMGINWYKRFGYIYNPAYVTMYCDTELTEVSRMLNREVYIPQMIIEHMHPYNGDVPFDELYTRNNNASADARLYQARRAKNFFIPRVVIHQPGRTGDIIITLPIAKHFYDQNCQVFWLCPEGYHEIFRDIDYVTPVATMPECDKVIDLSFGFGGSPESWWQQNKESFDSFVRAKYYLAFLNPNLRWQLEWNRNKEAEDNLFHKVARRAPYFLTHEGTHTGKYINIEYPNKVEFAPVEGYNIFDWYQVINMASEIHCIDSALANFIEAVPEWRNKKKHIYSKVRENNLYLRSIYLNNWIYE